MATVTSKTAAAIDTIDNAGIVSAHLDGASHLILVKKDNSTIDAGSMATTATPAGTVVMFGGSVAPAGWLLCNGQTISRSTYSSLYTAIGSAYGDGDHSTTFNVPNLEARFPRMEAAARGSTGGSIASHTHTIPTHVHNAHGHDLEGGTPVAHARINVQTGGGPNIQVDRVDVASYTSDINADMTNSALTSGSPTRGAKLSGKTDQAGDAVTNKTQMITDLGGGLPPYLNLNFIIKT